MTEYDGQRIVDDEGPEVAAAEFAGSVRYNAGALRSQAEQLENRAEEEGPGVERVALKNTAKRIRDRADDLEETARGLDALAKELK